MTIIEDWDSEDEKLIAEMKAFEEEWTHMKPCKIYKQTGYCSHLERAKSQKFKGRVREHLMVLSSYIKSPTLRLIESVK
jgi:hypothetical protein